MIEKRNDSENEFSAKKLQKLQQPKSSTYAQSSVRLKIHNRIRKSPVTRLQINNPPNDRKKPSLKITRARKHCLHIASEMPRISYKPNCNNKKNVSEYFKFRMDACRGYACRPIQGSVLFLHQQQGCKKYVLFRKNVVFEVF